MPLWSQGVPGVPGALLGWGVPARTWPPGQRLATAVGTFVRAEVYPAVWASTSAGRNFTSLPLSPMSGGLLTP
jgi:hypothetical protein